MTIQFVRRLALYLRVGVCNPLQISPFPLTCNYSTVRKRFYKHVSVTQSNGNYEVNLDRRKLKTPIGKVFQVPNEPLAIAVATEWDSQTTVVSPQYMHLTSLCNTVIDNPTNKSPHDYIDAILSSLESDTICFRDTEPDDLVNLQRKEWDPMVEWFCKRFTVQLEPSYQIIGTQVLPATMEVIRRHLSAYNIWALVGYNFATDNLKSLVLTQAAVDRFLTVEKAVALSRLEVEFQIAQWGNVEWAHDVDLMDQQCRLATALLFVYTNSQSSDKQYKSKPV